MKNKRFFRYLVGIIGIVSLATIFIYAQTATEKPKMYEEEMKNCPMHEQHQKAKKEGVGKSNHDHSKMAELNKRGEQGMGFSQTVTTHHFLIFSDGGAIQVEVNNKNDKDNLEKIRKHLAKIAVSFTNGDFATPLAVHAELPPGTKTMELLKGKITYKYSDLEKGGQVKIYSQDEIALAAIRDFLRYQIVEHQTGDSLDVK